ncbi:MAG: hypothetical protein WDW36_006093 [Sanguina aurantia]
MGLSSSAPLAHLQAEAQGMQVAVLKTLLMQVLRSAAPPASLPCATLPPALLQELITPDLSSAASCVLALSNLRAAADVAAAGRVGQEAWSGRFLAEADNMQQHPAMLTDQASVTDRAVSSMLQSLAELEAQGRLTQEAREYVLRALHPVHRPAGPLPSEGKICPPILGASVGPFRGAQSLGRSVTGLPLLPEPPSPLTHSPSDAAHDAGETIRLLALRVAELEARLQHADDCLTEAHEDLARDEEIFSGQSRELDALRRAALEGQRQRGEAEARHESQVETLLEELRLAVQASGTNGDHAQRDQQAQPFIPTHQHDPSSQRTHQQTHPRYTTTAAEWAARTLPAATAVTLCHATVTHTLTHTLTLTQATQPSTAVAESGTAKKKKKKMAPLTQAHVH